MAIGAIGLLVLGGLIGLGGPDGLKDIYIELTNETRTTLLRQGVRTVPVTIHNGTIHEGVRGISFFEDLTGCKYGLPGEAIR